jgi:uncharacterized coiled-coil DUF342 family protein
MNEMIEEMEELKKEKDELIQRLNENPAIVSQEKLAEMQRKIDQLRVGLV